MARPLDLMLVVAKRKLTFSILNQMDEAKVTELYFFQENPENILGYVNSAIVGKPRVFIGRLEDGDYRKITNNSWEKATNSDTVAYAVIGEKVVGKKEFSSKRARDKFVSAFKEVKQIALQTHIYI